MAVLPLKDVVNVIVNLSPRSAVRSGFNLSLLIGDSAVLSAENRVAVYSSMESMKDDGFTTDTPEYQAAQIYFSQSSNPSKVAIGYWDSATESLAEAIAACRAFNLEWWGCVPLGKKSETGDFVPATASDLMDAALTVESTTPDTVMICALADLTFLGELKAKSYRRTLGIFSEDVNKAVAITGYAMGANTGLANSAYTLKFKKLVGVVADPLKEAQVSDAEAVNANVYINRGATYDLFEQGTMADGTWFDEMINLDMLSNYIQLSVMDILCKTTKIPQTEAGVATIINAFLPDLDNAVKIGFLAPGIWTATGFMDIEQGDAIEKGYQVMSEAIDDQTTADRDARICPPIYVALKLAGAIHSVVIQLNVNR
ncbi:MAG: DUF3383 domain-containing protein [Eubacterium sp.]|nr:DUF3383 domain-containing protein [Eubacterium sp.]